MDAGTGAHLSGRLNVRDKSGPFMAGSGLRLRSPFCMCRMAPISFGRANVASRVAYGLLSFRWGEERGWSLRGGTPGFDDF